MADQVQMGGEPPVTTTDPLVVYLYLLLREGAVAPGEAEGRMLEIEGAEEIEFSLTNRFLAGYAENLAKRLKKITPPFDERGLEPVERCGSISPESRVRCMLDAGHEGAHHAERGEFSGSSWGNEADPGAPDLIKRLRNLSRQEGLRIGESLAAKSLDEAASRIVQLESALVRLLNHSPPRHQQDPAYLAVIRWARDMYNGEDPFKLTRAGNCPDCGEAPACENPHTPDGDPCSHPCHEEARS